MCSQTTEHPHQYIKSKILYTKMPPKITKLNHQITKQIHIQEANLPIQIPKIINKCILPNKVAMTSLDQNSRRNPQKLYRAC